MARLRPRVVLPDYADDMLGMNAAADQPSDPQIAQIVKYIPAESITTYQAVVGIAGAMDNVVIFVSLLLLILTPIWTYYATKDKSERPAWHQVVASFLAFGIWLMAINNSAVHHVLPFWNTSYGSMLLIISSTMLLPLIGKIINRHVA